MNTYGYSKRKVLLCAKISNKESEQTMNAMLVFLGTGGVLLIAGVLSIIFGCRLAGPYSVLVTGLGGCSCVFSAGFIILAYKGPDIASRHACAATAFLDSIDASKHRPSVRPLDLVNIADKAKCREAVDWVTRVADLSTTCSRSRCLQRAFVGRKF